MKDIDKFPSIENVHEVLSDLTGLFDDRNKLLDTMFREDKYKDFLLAENMQQLAEADKRDDSANGRIKKDLANGYEVLKAQTTMKKFANFISPGALPPMDLTSSDDYSEDDDYVEEEAPVEKEAPEKGDKGDKGDDGADAEIVQPKPDKPKPKSRVFSWQKQQTPKLKLQEGGAVAPSPMMNSLTPTAGQRPETKSGVKSLESLGLVGKKNVASELTEDLGLEEYKKALADAMALPLKAVAAGLAGLLDNMDVPGGETAALEGQVAKVGKTFGVKTKKKKKENKLMNFVQGGGIVGALGRMFGGGKKKKKGPQTYDEAMAESDAFAADVQKIVDPYGSDDTMEDYEPKGGPSLVRSAPGYLGIGGASHEPVAPDTLSTSGDTKIDAMRNSITNITQGAKNMMANAPMVRGIKAAGGVISKLLGKVQPASEGSQYNSQDINTLTNQVMMENEQMFNQQTDIALGAMGDSSDEGTKAIMAAIAKMGNTPMGIGEEDPLPPAPLKPSKHLLHSISIVDGGQTPHDIV
mgnify:FL=1